MLVCVRLAAGWVGVGGVRWVDWVGLWWVGLGRLG